MLNALIIACSLTAAAGPSGAGWTDAPGDDPKSIDAALAALPAGHVLLVEVSAAWCAPCNQLKNEVLDTRLGATALEGAVGVVVDWETPAGDAVRKRFGVLGLPTTLVLAADGAELGRVEGYDGRDAWVEAVRDAKAGRVGLAALEAKAVAAPDDATAQITLAQARLVRGDVARAERALRAVMARDGDDGAHAARVLGRWYLRAQDDPQRALEHFSLALKQYDGTKHHPHFLYWTAKAHHHAGQPAEALALFTGWRDRWPKDAKPLQYQADFMAHHGYDAAATAAVARQALALAPDDAHTHYVLARVLAAGGDADGARDAIAEARRLAPEAALFANFARGLETAAER